MMTSTEVVLRRLLAEAYTPEGVEIVMHSRLRLDDGDPRTWEQYVAEGQFDVLFDWAESLTGMTG